MPAETLPSDAKKIRVSRRGKKLGNLLVSGIALVILFAANKKVPETMVFTGTSTNTSYMVAQNQSEAVICSTKGEWCAIDTPLAFLYSADHQHMAYVDQDQELYDLDGVDSVFIDNDVLQAKLSFYGDMLAYIKEAEDGQTELCICSLLSKEIERLHVDHCTEFALSSDGRTIAYLEQKGENLAALSVWQYGKSKREITDRVLSVLSVSDNGTQIFYIKESNQLCSYSWDGEHELAVLSGAVQYLVNESQTELLCTDLEDAYYCASGTQEALRLNGVKGRLFFSAKTSHNAHPQGQNGQILEGRTLKGQTFVTYDDKSLFYKIYQLEKSGEGAELLLKTSAL